MDAAAPASLPSHLLPQPICGIPGAREELLAALRVRFVSGARWIPLLLALAATAMLAAAAAHASVFRVGAVLAILAAASVLPVTSSGGLRALCICLALGFGAVLVWVPEGPFRATLSLGLAAALLAVAIVPFLGSGARRLQHAIVREQRGLAGLDGEYAAFAHELDRQVDAILMANGSTTPAISEAHSAAKAVLAQGDREGWAVDSPNTRRYLVYVSNLLSQWKALPREFVTAGDEAGGTLPRLARTVAEQARRLAAKHVGTPGLMRIQDFDRSTARASGGVTGSVRVRGAGDDDNQYQLKASVLDQTLARQGKADWTDRENLSEAIAAAVGAGLSEAAGERLVPEVALVYDGLNRRVLVASKYLRAARISTLDEYIQEINMRRTSARHVVLQKPEPRREMKEREYLVTGEGFSQLRRDIARGLAISILVGDHDVNPGNFVVLHRSADANEQVRVARIDFGHAFLDLIKSSQLFGGQLRDAGEPARDFIDRGTIDGLRFGDPPKLWRDMPAMVPSAELADAMLQVGNEAAGRPDMAQRLALPRFLALLDAARASADERTRVHVARSLGSIANTLTESTIGRGAALDHTVLMPEVAAAVAMRSVDMFLQQVASSMLRVQPVVALQAAVERDLLLGKTPEQIRDAHEDEYAGLLASQGATATRRIRWLRRSAEGPAGRYATLQEYAEMVRKELFGQ